MAEQPARKRGRSATRTEDWESTHKRIRLLNATFERWRALKNGTKIAERRLCRILPAFFVLRIELRK